MAIQNGLSDIVFRFTARFFMHGFFFSSYYWDDSESENVNFDLCGPDGFGAMWACGWIVLYIDIVY